MKLKIKIIITALIWLTYGIGYKLFYPIITNDIAIKQFEDTAQSFTDIQSYYMITGSIGIALIIITLLIFKNNIRNLF